MKPEIKELVKSFKSKKKNERERYNDFLYHCFMAYHDKVKPKLPDKVKNKYITFLYQSVADLAFLLSDAY